MKFKTASIITAICTPIRTEIKMTNAEWQHQNLINIALDLDCTEAEIRGTFTGDLKFREFLEAQLQKVVADRKAAKKLPFAQTLSEATGQTQSAIDAAFASAKKARATK